MLCQLTVIQALTQNPDTDESYNLEKNLLLVVLLPKRTSIIYGFSCVSKGFPRLSLTGAL